VKNKSWSLFVHKGLMFLFLGNLRQCFETFFKNESSGSIIVKIQEAIRRVPKMSTMRKTLIEI